MGHDTALLRSNNTTVDREDQSRFFDLNLAEPSPWLLGGANFFMMPIIGEISRFYYCYKTRGLTDAGEKIKICQKTQAFSMLNVASSEVF